MSVQLFFLLFLVSGRNSTVCCANVFVRDSFTVLRCVFAVDFDFLEFTCFASH